MAFGLGTILRAEDLLVLGVEWVGMEAVAVPAGAPPELEVVEEGARLVVTLPPQHIAEQPANWKGWDSDWHPLAGSLPPGAPIAAVAVSPALMYVVFAGDDGNSWANRWQSDTSGNPWSGRWVLEGPLPGASFRPGSSMVGLTPDGVTAEIYAIDSEGTLSVAGSSWEDYTLTGWSPVDNGFGNALATGFTPGGDVQIANRNGDASVFAINGGTLMHWRKWGGFETVRPLPAGARFKAVAHSAVIATVFWVSDDGQLMVNWWDGETWREQGLGAPPTMAPLTPATRVEAAFPREVAFPTGFVLLPVHPGVLWGATLSLTFDEPPLWQVGEWAMLPGAYPQPDGHVSALAHVHPDSTRHLILLADTAGAVQALTVTVSASLLEVERDDYTGDWFPPGAPVAVVRRGGVIDAFAASSDRIVRHSGRAETGDWWTGSEDHSAVLGIGRKPANLSSPSRIAFEFPQGARITLTAEGVLNAMRRFPVAGWPAGGTQAAGEETIIELPWGLFVSLHDMFTFAEHLERPAASPRGAVEPWHTQIASSTDLRGPGPARIRPLGVRDDPRPPFPGEALTPPLDVVAREAIARLGLEQPFTAGRLILSSLGGWLTATGSWPDFEWEHDAVAGRDLMVRTARRGVLYPLGQEVTYHELARRRFDPRSDRSVAVIHQQGALHVSEPLRRYGDLASRLFPFDESELTVDIFTNLDAPVWEGTASGPAGYFFRPRLNGKPVLFPVVLRNGGGNVATQLPVLFVDTVGQSLGVKVGKELAKAYESANTAAVPGTAVRLTEHESFEVHELELTATSTQATSAGFLPQLSGAKIGLPAVRQLANEAEAKPYKVAFTTEYIESGTTDPLFNVVGGTIAVDFAGVADRAGGLATPSFDAQAVSGSGAPVNTAAFGPNFDPSKLFPEGAKLLGTVSLKEVVQQAAGAEPPSIQTASDDPLRATLEWNATLGSSGPFHPIEGQVAKLALNVDATAGAPPQVQTTGSLTDFRLDLAGVLVVSFKELTFASKQDEKPKLGVKGLDLRLGGDLSFLAVLQDVAKLLTGEVPVTVEAMPNSVRASHHVKVPALTLPVGVFSVSVSDLVFRASVLLPFDGEVEVDFSFSSREHPFRVGVWILGGDGFLDLKIRNGKLKGLIAAIGIGGLWKIDWVIVTGEVHALASIDIRLVNGTAMLSGSLRVGGSVSVLGLVSVSIEVSATIVTEIEPAFRVVARARLVIDVDLFLISTGVDLEQEITIYEEEREGRARPPLGGGSGRAMRISQGELPEDEARAAWDEYRAAFEPAETG